MRSSTVLPSRIWEVEHQRDKCRANKLYRKAQQLENEVHEIKRVLEGQKLHDLDAGHAKEHAANDVAFQQSLQKQLQQWSSQMHGLQLQLQAADQQMLARHAEELAALQASQAAEHRHPKFSPGVLNLRHIEQSLAAQKEYSKAAKVKQQADRLEQMELSELGAGWAAKCEAVLARLQERHSKEREAAAKKASYALLAAKQRQELEQEQLHKRYQAAKLALTRSQAAQRLALQQSLRGSLGLAKPSTLLHLPSLNSSLADTRELLPSSAMQKHQPGTAVHVNSSQGSSRASSPSPAHPSSSRASSPSPVPPAGSSNGGSKLRQASRVPDRLPPASASMISLSPSNSWAQDMHRSSSNRQGRRSPINRAVSPGPAAAASGTFPCGTSSSGRVVSFRPAGSITPYITSQVPGSRGGARAGQGSSSLDMNSLHLQPLAAQAARPATATQAQAGGGSQCPAGQPAPHTWTSGPEHIMSLMQPGTGSCRGMNGSNCISSTINCNGREQQQRQQHSGQQQQQQDACNHKMCSSYSGSAPGGKASNDMCCTSRALMETVLVAGVCAAAKPVMGVAFAASTALGSNPYCAEAAACSGSSSSSSSSSNECPDALLGARSGVLHPAHPQETGPAMDAGIEVEQPQIDQALVAEASKRIANCEGRAGQSLEGAGSGAIAGVQAELLTCAADGTPSQCQEDGSCSTTAPLLAWSMTHAAQTPTSSISPGVPSVPADEDQTLEIQVAATEASHAAGLLGTALQQAPGDDADDQQQPNLVLTSPRIAGAGSGGLEVLSEATKLFATSTCRHKPVVSVPSQSAAAAPTAAAPGLAIPAEEQQGKCGQQKEPGNVPEQQYRPESVTNGKGCGHAAEEDCPAGTAVSEHSAVATLSQHDHQQNTQQQQRRRQNSEEASDTLQIDDEAPPVAE